MNTFYTVSQKNYETGQKCSKKTKPVRPTVLQRHYKTLGGINKTEFYSFVAVLASLQALIECMSHFSLRKPKAAGTQAQTRTGQ